MGTLNFGRINGSRRLKKSSKPADLLSDTCRTTYLLRTSILFRHEKTKERTFAIEE